MDINSFILGFVKGRASGGGGGGGGVQADALSVSYKSPVPCADSTVDLYTFVYKGDLWMAEKVFSSGALATIVFHKYNGEEFVAQKEWAVADLPDIASRMFATRWSWVEYDGKMYFNNTYTSPCIIWSFDGISLEKICDSPEKSGAAGLFVQNGNLYHLGTNYKKVYKFNNSSKTFEEIYSFSELTNRGSYCAIVDNVPYLYGYGNTYAVYRFDATVGEFIRVHDAGVFTRSSASFVKDGCAYYMNTSRGLSSSNSYYVELYKLDFVSNTEELVGYFPQCMTALHAITFNGEVLLFGRGSKYAAQLHGLTT